MKKRTIWILIILMVVTIVGLVLVQIRYVRINAEMIENQFKENVQRSLFQTVRLVEENEALQYLLETLEDADYSTKSNRMIKSGAAQRDALGMTTDSMAMDSGKDFTLNQKLPSIQLPTGFFTFKNHFGSGCFQMAQRVGSKGNFSTGKL